MESVDTNQLITINPADAFAAAHFIRHAVESDKVDTFPLEIAAAARILSCYFNGKPCPADVYADFSRICALYTASGQRQIVQLSMECVEALPAQYRADNAILMVVSDRPQ